MDGHEERISGRWAQPLTWSDDSIRARAKRALIYDLGRLASVFTSPTGQLQTS